MELVYEGLLLGLTLTMLVGPLFVALTQTSVQRGVRAGLWVGTGIWVSDVLVILASWIFVREIQLFTTDAAFRWWVGLAGGIILIVSGIAAMANRHAHDLEAHEFSAAGGLGYFFKGFAVNFINPFTFVFWTGVSGHYNGVRGLASGEAFLLFAAIMGTIMATDSLKIGLAGWIRNRLTISRLVLLGRISGMLLILFGALLIARSAGYFTDLQ